MASRFFSFAGSFLRRPQTCAAIGMAWTTQKLFTQKVECAPGLNKQIYHPYSIFEGSQGESWESEHPNVTILKSNVVLMLLTQMRKRDIHGETFRFYADRLAHILVEEALAMLATSPIVVQTHTGGLYAGIEFDPNLKLCVVSILRAGDSLIKPVRNCMPNIPVGKILIQRDESSQEKRAVLHYVKLPEDISNRHVLLVDPMLATGGSASLAIDILLSKGVKQENIIFLNHVACPEGVDVITSKYPQVKIITAAVDERLNEEKYIIPGLGDFGDRYYGT